uniref:Uncharacterized protein n=1 Tax=viral metagenome TaxID=1070528 RepID=A0A6C0C294_9ZZZZ
MNFTWKKSALKRALLCSVSPPAMSHSDKLKQYQQREKRNGQRIGWTICRFTRYFLFVVLRIVVFAHPSLQSLIPSSQ